MWSISSAFLFLKLNQTNVSHYPCRTLYKVWLAYRSHDSRGHCSIHKLRNHTYSPRSNSAFCQDIRVRRHFLCCSFICTIVTCTLTCGIVTCILAPPLLGKGLPETSYFCAFSCTRYWIGNEAFHQSARYQAFSRENRQPSSLKRIQPRQFLLLFFCLFIHFLKLKWIISRNKAIHSASGHFHRLKPTLTTKLQNSNFQPRFQTLILRAFLFEKHVINATKGY